MNISSLSYNVGSNMRPPQKWGLLWGGNSAAPLMASVNGNSVRHTNNSTKFYNNKKSFGIIL